MDVVLLRFDAPLMSFGGVLVDQHNKTDAFPYRAMLTGLIANALGLLRADASLHEAIQARLRYAARRDRAGSVLVDYQTVDFDPAGSMGSDLAWTTCAVIEERKGGDAAAGTHIRYRHYLADAIITVAFTLDPPGTAPTLRAVSDALQRPARPLFLGRKCCIPSGPIWLGESEAASLRGAIETAPRTGAVGKHGKPRSDCGPLAAVWPRADGGEEARSRLWPRVEDRDWENAIHVGRRVYIEGLVDPPGESAADPAREVDS
ncbi:MAG: type I-E CRISPR-associated protein Cas5/CasD [Deltaproteobacteria bacterium]|nr:type I-E CRISPR-associated protein Cas5/CasD [Deltaproteobacteria bacterium]